MDTRKVYPLLYWVSVLEEEVKARKRKEKKGIGDMTQKPLQNTLQINS